MILQHLLLLLTPYKQATAQFVFGLGQIFKNYIPRRIGKTNQLHLYLQIFG